MNKKTKTASLILIFLLIIAIPAMNYLFTDLGNFSNSVSIAVNEAEKKEETEGEETEENEEISEQEIEENTESDIHISEDIDENDEESLSSEEVLPEKEKEIEAETESQAETGIDAQNTVAEEQEEEIFQDSDAIVSEELKENQAPISVAPAFTLPGDSIVVYNFDEFKKALSENNGYTNIYLGADITMKALGIEIHSGKMALTISGINPLNGSGPFMINEYNSLDPVYTIRVTSNSGTKELTLKNVNVTGRNYYGAICIFDAVTDVKVIFENVNYNGPQLSYNRGGTVSIIGNSQIDIIGENGLSDAQELAEAENLELGGNTVINHYSPALSGLWLTGNNSGLRILSGSNVVWNETGTYMIYQDNITPADFTMEKDSRFSLNTKNGIFYNNSVSYHQFGNVLIDSGASLFINQQGTSALPVMKVKKTFEILEGASFVILSQSASEIIQLTNEVDLSINSPDTFVLYNKNNKLIEWIDTKEHEISIQSSFLNYWQTPCEISLLGGFEDSPLHRWRKKNGENLSVEITATSNSTKSVVSNYSENDYGIAPTENSLNISKAKIITAGKMRLDIDIITDSNSYISGESEPEAMIKAVYTDLNGNEQTVFAQADHSGSFIINLEKGLFPMLDSEVTVYSGLGYKNVFEKTTVVDSQDYTLRFAHLPKTLAFNQTNITGSQITIPRADENWNIIIEDTRNKGSKWELYARLTGPLIGEKDDFNHPVENAVVYKDNDENTVAFTNDALKIFQGTKEANSQTLISWSADKGILLHLNTLEVYSNVNYKTSVEWLLIDAP